MIYCLLDISYILLAVRITGVIMVFITYDYHGSFLCDYVWVMCVTLLCSSFQSDGLFTLLTDIGHLNMNASYYQDQNKKT